MRDKTGHSGRKALLIVALVATCCAADWTDDLYSANVAAQYTALQNANGTRRLTGGGGINTAMMFSTFGQRDRDNKGTPNSPLEAVFGNPFARDGGKSDASDEVTRLGFNSANSSDIGRGAALMTGRSAGIMTGTSVGMIAGSTE